MRIDRLAKPSTNSRIVSTSLPIPLPRRAGEGASILVVDDDPDTLSTTACLLKHRGYDVHIAQDGEQAIEIARRQHPKYVLLDVGLPGLDGYQVASRLRQELAESVVIVAVTGYAQQDDRRRALSAGFNYFLAKPILDQNVLIALLSDSDIR
jgi:CheY-like chemotaxis protein